MFYAGEEVPWHKLGTHLDEPATAAEAIDAAGLAYRVDLVGLTTTDGTPVHQRKAVVRHDTGAILGVVGNSYRPVQNAEAFAFLDALVADDLLRYETAGALGKGQRVWMLAKLPGHIRVKNSEDITNKYLLLSNSHDGSSALRIFFSGIRVVCQNTLILADQQGRGQGVYILHKGNLASKIRQAREILGLAHTYFDDLAGQLDQLANSYPSSSQLRVFFESLYPNPPSGESTRAENVRQTLFKLYEQGVGQDIPAIRHTALAALNSVSEFIDHHRSTRGRSPEERAGRRLESALFGTGAEIKSRALTLALQMAESN
jgi:phage/plasmid-like protein (TIGR03299 family)